MTQLKLREDFQIAKQPWDVRRQELHSVLSTLPAPAFVTADDAGAAAADADATAAGGGSFGGLSVDTGAVNGSERDGEPASPPPVPDTGTRLTTATESKGDDEQIMAAAAAAAAGVVANNGQTPPPSPKKVHVPPRLASSH